MNDRELRQRHKSLEAFRTQEAITDAVSKRNRQVAHDIRDPVSVLDKFILSVPELPHELHQLAAGAIHRIKDIANDLLIQKGTTVTTTNVAKSNGTPETELLSSLVAPIVSEKRIQFRERKGIELSCAFDSPWYGAFVIVQMAEFRRVLSNLLNNAIQAIEDGGKVKVTISRKKSCHVLRVSDTGKGIPSEIIPLLGQEGFTYGKEDGSGLGIFHAINAIRSWGGTLSISSTEGAGTVVEISLPSVDPPRWFKPDLVISDGACIVVLDDERYTFELWKSRLPKRNLHYFRNIHALETWHSVNPSLDAMFLCDLDLKSKHEDGLNVVIRLKLEKRSVLVTGHHSEARLRERCEKLGVQIIPKEHIQHVPISFKSAGGAV